MSNRLSAHIKSLANTLTLKLFIYNVARGMLGDVVNSVSFAVVTVMSLSCFEQYPFP